MTGSRMERQPSALWTLPGRSAPLQVAELVEHEQRVVAAAAEVAVVGRAFLPPERGALRAIPVEDDAVRWPAPMHPVDPPARQGGKSCKVGLGGQPLGLEAAHLAAGRR